MEQLRFAAPALFPLSRRNIDGRRKTCYPGTRTNCREAERGFVMTYEDMFAKVKALLEQADAGGIREHLAYQFNITGEAGGTFYIEVKDGALSVEPYDYRDRDAAFTCSAETLFKIASGKTDPVGAVLTGKLKVEGNIDKALRLKELLPKRP